MSKGRLKGLSCKQYITLAQYGFGIISDLHHRFGCRVHRQTFIQIASLPSFNVVDMARLIWAGARPRRHRASIRRAPRAVADRIITTLNIEEVLYKNNKMGRARPHQKKEGGAGGGSRRFVYKKKGGVQTRFESISS
ncbi:hypothetical protein EVAR_40882_1 [Eumeta japonica]|uniref:Uncharacterized protein n=1 Tax=Eumeta variegata TaxID=151549 RepID=A0A4C1X4E0_EUMVA|nr:hypothetical protein EVAR_40882_1 [Eumeta japonica]